MVLLRPYFAFELDDPAKDVGRGAIFPRGPTVEIVDADVDDQSNVRLAVVVDHICDGVYEEIPIHAKALASAVPQLLDVAPLWAGGSRKRPNSNSVP